MIFEVQDLRPGLFQAADLLRQVSKIGGQERGLDHGSGRPELGDDIFSRHRNGYLRLDKCTSQLVVTMPVLHVSGGFRRFCRYR